MAPISPKDIGQRGSWDGFSDHPVIVGRTVPNKDTSMDWPEHQSIIMKAAGLLALDVPPAFADLRHAFHGEKSVPDSGSVSTVKIYVSKGIHQPETNPHIQLETEAQLLGHSVRGDKKSKLVPRTDVAPRVWKYHLNVSAVNTLSKGDSFQWVGVQFTRQVGSTIHVWPAVATVVMKAPVTVVGRRSSISSSALAAHVEAARIAAEIAAFDELSLAFETTHKIKPIDRQIRIVQAGWGAKPTYTGLSAATNRAVVKFQFSKATGFVVVPG
jgi:hypothetical protein